MVSGDAVEETAAVRVHRGVEARSARLRDLYAEADAFALPTQADATPWAVLEAMAAGLPVVATRVGAIAELLGDAGETIEPGGVGELADALSRLTDPALRRSSASGDCNGCGSATTAKRRRRGWSSSVSRMARRPARGAGPAAASAAAP